MYFDERRAHFLQDRLQRRLKECRARFLLAYYRLLTSHAGQGRTGALLENLTVNETSFFRNKPQLDLFQKTMLEELLQAQAGRGATSRCASGARAVPPGRSLHPGHAGGRRAGLLLPAQSAAV